MRTINGTTYVTNWDLRFLDRLPIGGRVFHLLPDAQSILHLCESITACLKAAACP